MINEINIDKSVPLLRNETSMMFTERNKQYSLWRSFVDGDENCYKSLFKSYYKELYGYGLKLCNQPDLVKDSIQELFEKIWERRSNLSHIDSPRVYLFVSLRRKILLKMKKHKFRTDLHEVDESTLLNFGIEDFIIRDETRVQQKKKILEALNQLSDRQKEIIYLFFYNGMSYNEIEKILSIKRQSVSNLMFRSLETLRSILKKSEILGLFLISIVVIHILGF